MAQKMQKNKCLTGVLLQQYIETIFNTLKSLAFHEIYMQNQREQLCKTESYDSLTAFKAIDSFKHNKIVACQLRSFLRLEQNGSYEVTERQCWEALNSLNKKLSAIQYEDFEEMTMPCNVVLRNISLSRYNNLEVKVGTMSQLYDIKSTSSKKITAFFMKQIEFYRELLIRKQNFCQKYGGDLYTFSQLICKGKDTKFNFDQFYNLCRSYKFYFNHQEFIALYKRTKSIPRPSPLFYDKILDIQIAVNDLSYCLLASLQQLDVKNKIRIVSGQPFDHIKQPSYKGPSIRLRQENQRIEKEIKNKKKFISDQRQIESIDKRDIRYRYCFPEHQLHPYRHRFQLKEKEKVWNQEVLRMGESEIDIRYGMIDKKHYFI